MLCLPGLNQEIGALQAGIPAPERHEGGNVVVGKKRHLPQQCRQQIVGGGT
jgi:hypothetical protein